MGQQSRVENLIYSSAKWWQLTFFETYENPPIFRRPFFRNLNPPQILGTTFQQHPTTSNPTIQTIQQHPTQPSKPSNLLNLRHSKYHKSPGSHRTTEAYIWDAFQEKDPKDPWNHPIVKHQKEGVEPWKAKGRCFNRKVMKGLKGFRKLSDQPSEITQVILTICCSCLSFLLIFYLSNRGVLSIHPLFKDKFNSDKFGPIWSHCTVSMWNIKAIQVT